MSRNGKGNNLALPITLLVLFALGLLPTRWLGFASDLSAIVNLPVAPLAQVGNAVQEIVRPPTEIAADWPEAVREKARLLEEERNRWERMYRVKEEEVAALQEQIRQLQMVPIDTIRVPIRPLQASVTMRDPSDLHGPVRLHASERQGLVANTAAVYGGVYLLGRVTEVDQFSATLLPLTNAANDGINARIFSQSRLDESTSASRSPRVRLSAQRNGLLIGDISREVDAGPGDIVALSDSSWPEAAQFMRIGSILEVREKEENPLRRVIVVKPTYAVGDVSSVTLLVEDRSGGTEGATP